MQSDEYRTLSAHSVERNLGAADASPGAGASTKPPAPSESLTDAHAALTGALRTIEYGSLGRAFAVLAFGGFDVNSLHSQLQSPECIASALQRLASVSSDDLRRCFLVLNQRGMGLAKSLNILACTIPRPHSCARIRPWCPSQLTTLALFLI